MTAPLPGPWGRHAERDDSHDGAGIDLAYAAIFDEYRNDDSGSTEAKLARAAAALPFLAAGPAALLGNAAELSAHALRMRAKAQTSALLGASPAAKPDSASQDLWRLHPWRLADGSSPVTRSAFYEWLPQAELEIAAERTAESLPVADVRALAAWHVEMDCAACMAEHINGGAEHCPFWTVGRMLAAYEVPFAPDFDPSKVGVGVQAPAEAAEAALVATECAKLVRLGVLEIEKGPPEPGAILSSVQVVQKRVVIIDEATQSRVDDAAFVAQRGLARGAAVTDRAQREEKSF